MANLISPLLWQSVPFASETAYLDFHGQHERWHYELAKATGTPFILTDDLKQNLTPHANMHNALADALGVTRVGDLETFDLEDETSWISFHFLNAADHQRFRTPAGL